MILGAHETTTQSIHRRRIAVPGRPVRALIGSIALVFSVGCGASQSSAETVANPDPLDLVSARELYDAGVTLLQSGDFVRAEQYLLAARDRGYPENEIIPPLVSACLRSSRLSAALAHAEPYLARHPAQWQLRLLVGTVHLGLGEVSRAEQEFARVVADAPDEPAGHYLLAVLARDELAEPERAREHFQRYIDLAPEGEHAEEARGSLTGRAAPIGAADAGPTRLPRHRAEGEGMRLQTAAASDASERSPISAPSITSTPEEQEP